MKGFSRWSFHAAAGTAVAASAACPLIGMAAASKSPFSIPSSTMRFRRTSATPAMLPHKCSPHHNGIAFHIKQNQVPTSNEIRKLVKRLSPSDYA